VKDLEQSTLQNVNQRPELRKDIVCYLN